MNNKIKLSLKKKWFELTKSGEKTEDYRDITPYWCNRFLLYEGRIRTVKWWTMFCNDAGDNAHIALEIDCHKSITFREYDINIMTLGYPKKDDFDKYLIFNNDGILVNTGVEEWGAEKDKIYFVVRHGKQKMVNLNKEKQ